MNNALPPGTNHKAASDQLANETQRTVTAAMERSTAPRPAGPQATATVLIPVKSSRSTTART